MKYLLITCALISTYIVNGQSNFSRQFQGQIIRSNTIDGDKALIGIKGKKPGDGIVYYSENAMQSWTPCNNGLALSQQVEDVQAVCIVNDSTFLAGTWKNGLFRSTNTGKTWIALNNFPSKDVRSFAKTPTAIYAATTTHGVLQSTDNGQTWTACSDTSYHKQTASWSLEVDPVDNRILYATSFKNGLQQSQDKGKTWRKILSHKGMMFYDLVISKKDHNMIYAVGCNDSLGVLYRSKNHGMDWELLTELPAGALNQFMLHENLDNTMMVGSWDKGVFIYIKGKWYKIERLGDIPVADIKLLEDDNFVIFSWGNGIYRSSHNELKK